jgi:hypothetical protein
MQTRDTNIVNWKLMGVPTTAAVIVAALMFALIAMPLAAASTTTFYVATNGNDAWNGLSPTYTGGINGPFASLAKAQLAARTKSSAGSVTIQVRAGTYYLPMSPTNAGTLVFTSADSGNATSPILWENYPGETPIVSGGVPVGTGGLGLSWTSTALKLYQVQLPSSLQPFEYLFYTPQVSHTGPVGPRRLRSRLESQFGVGYYMSGGVCHSTTPPGTVATSLCNLGTFLRVLNPVAPTDPDGMGCPSVTNFNNSAQSKCLDRFYYNPSDPITNWLNLNGTYTGNPASPCQSSTNPYPVGDIGIMLFDAWTVDDMRVGCLDTSQGVLFLNNATKGNTKQYDTFGPTAGHRYVVENTKDAFQAAYTAGQTGLWFLDRSTTQPILYYIANTGENPNLDTVVIPQLGGQFPVSGASDYVGGSLISATNLSYVTFQGITFEVDNFTPSYTTGFNNDVNGEMSVPQAIDCESCQNVTFNGITIQDTSASGIDISSSSGSSGTAATNDTIENSTFNDIGDSGIRIGHTPNSHDMAAIVVNNITVQNNLIDGYSRVFPDGEGIAEGNGNNITYTHNDITDGYHAGISICQLACPGGENAVNGTAINSEYNHLWNMMQGITADGGSLYYNVGNENGSGSNDYILNNLVHDTTDDAIIDQGVAGSSYGDGEGLYLDAQSGGVKLENNVVYHVSGHAIHISDGPTVNNAANPNLFQNNILSLALKGMFAEDTPWPQLSNGSYSCTPGNPNIGLQAELFWNIFNFDQNEGSSFNFFVQGSCTDSCQLPYYKFQDFEGNAYWRAGTPGSGPLFCSDSQAFHVLTNPPTGKGAASCPGGPNTFLYFDSPPGGDQTWQWGAPPGTPLTIDEDRLTDVGVCNYNPSFGTTGNPSDYLLSPLNQPPTNFNITYTNNTINMAGRTSGSTPGVIPETFPTYHYSSF